MRTYAQYCAMAKALDLIGDRWTLLIVRELLLRGGSRYTDLRDGLPGIATNLLADRLHQLEQAGIVWREAAPPPIATTLYHLTSRGESLRPVIKELGRWGGPLLAEASGDDAFRSHWLALPAEELLRDQTPHEPAIAIVLRADDEPSLVIETVDGDVRARPGSVAAPNLVVSGPHRAIVSFMAGGIDVGDPQAHGLTFEGDVGALRRLQPGAAPAVTKSMG